MKVQLHWVPGTDSYGVWILQDFPERRVARISGRDEWLWEKVVDGQEVEPTLRLTSQVLEALRGELSEFGPLDNSNVSFLRDTIKTRDRLFSLVEKLTEN